MVNLSADVRLRPIRFGFLVRPDDVHRVTEICRVNTCLWGGKFNPIIPRLKNVPKWWNQDLEYFKRAFVEAFESKAVALNGVAFANLYESGFTSALRLGHSGIEIDTHGWHDPSIFVFDAQQSRDLIDFLESSCSAPQRIADSHAVARRALTLLQSVYRSELSTSARQPEWRDDPGHCDVCQVHSNRRYRDTVCRAPARRHQRRCQARLVSIAVAAADGTEGSLEARHRSHRMCMRSDGFGFRVRRQRSEVLPG